VLAAFPGTSTVNYERIGGVKREEQVQGQAYRVHSNSSFPVVKEKEECLHLHVLVEEVEEEFVATLVFFLDFWILEVGTTSHIIISLHSHNRIRRNKGKK
jgi:hypothetical protein